MKMKARRHERAKTPKKLALSRPSIAYTSLLIAAVTALALAGLVPLGAPFAFLPLAAYTAASIIGLGHTFKIRREGINQTLLSFLFTGLLIIAFRT